MGVVKHVIVCVISAMLNLYLCQLINYPLRVYVCNIQYASLCNNVSYAEVHVDAGTLYALQCSTHHTKSLLSDSSW